MSSFPSVHMNHAQHIESFSSRYSLTVTHLPRQSMSFRRVIMSLKERTEMNDLVYDVCKYCLKPEKDGHRLHLHRIKGEELILSFIKHAKQDVLNDKIVVHIMWCMVSCLHHFHNRLIAKRGSFLARFRLARYRSCLKTYKKLLEFITEEYYDHIMSAIIVIIIQLSFWQYEEFCTDILSYAVNVTNKYELTFNLILDPFFSETEDDYRSVIVLRRVILNCKWTSIPKEIILKFLEMIKSNIVLPAVNKISFAIVLFQCLKQMIPIFDVDEEKFLIETVFVWVKEDPNLYLTELINLIVLCKKMCEEAGSKLIHLGFNLLERANINNVGLILRTMIKLADTGENSSKFVTPKLFHENGVYKIKIRSLGSDKSFISKMLKDNCELFQKSFLNCIRNFNVSKDALETIYRFLCISLCEVPTGLSATAIASLAMGIQKYAQVHSGLLLFESLNHMHAMAISLVSLICYIHKASTFYKYVNHLVLTRASIAPHLNPPLRVIYQYPVNHILYTTPCILMDKWEIKYGLWITFRTKSRKLFVNEYEIV
ncbi:uncharacterized protein LOC109606924 [Aethina tumida]|uniref:uncharacterized protein LOC109606924 n=1 Tax=Aethina tumida TaxID=116153 RepID=UPI0021480FFA|nr:uncharacterized protein LOC109606924 [Aethina tumida]XP_049820526.1 uncharacterized protein LOC109606924 [Aethina tumida]